MRKKFDNVFIRFDTTPACDRQTDRQTGDDSNRRAMQSDARVNIESKMLTYDNVHNVNLLICQ